MKIGIFGGTFDPIHTGHISILKAAAESGYLDEIIVIPNAYPPHKSLEHISMATYRYEMTRIALEVFDFPIPVVLSDIELFRKGKSFTLDTILELKTTFSYEDQFVLIYGSDVIYEIENWYKPQQIMKECELFFAERPGFGGENFISKINELIERYSAKIAIFHADYIDISSSELRESIITNPETAKIFLVPALREWINKNGIYKNQKDLALISPDLLIKIQEYECELQKSITKKRLVHSINTMREAVKLAVLYNGDIQKSAIAGLLHDCAKSSIHNGDDQLNKNIIGKANSNSYSDIFHAYQGRQMAMDKFNINDTDILNAIYYHTTSRPNSSLLEKIIFVADKIEPARTFPRIDEIRLIAYHNLDEGLSACLNDIIKLLYSSDKTPHPDTIAAYETTKNEINE